MGKNQDFPLKIFCLTVPKNFVGNPLGCHHIRESKNFMLKRVMSRFFVEIFLFRSTEKLCRGTLLCCVSESLRYRISSWIRRGEYQTFPLKIFCLTVPKHFVDEPFYAVFQKISGTEKVYG